MSKLFQRYQRAVRAECISLMGCAEADDSLDSMGDNCFRANASFHYHRAHQPAVAARAWVNGVAARPHV